MVGFSLNEASDVGALPRSYQRRDRNEWRALGFFYDYDDRRGNWLFRASRSGFAKLCFELRQYAIDSKHALTSQHEHYGPYSYLKFVMWSELKVTADGIYGASPDFIRLAKMIELQTANAPPGTEVELAGQYFANSDSTLVLRVEPDGFDPSSCDRALR